jgi:hypothetical protein
VKDIKNLIKEILKEERNVTDIFRGWVNVKSDMQINERVSRLMGGLGFTSTGVDGLKQKIRFLSNPTGKIYERGGQSFAEEINRAIAAILITAFLKELRDGRLFDPSTSGFLFEPFIAGLLGMGRINPIGLPNDDESDIEGVIRDYGKTDVTDSEGNRYQCKLYSKSNDITIIKKVKDTDEFIVLLEGDNETNNNYPDYYVIGYKGDGSESVETHVISVDSIKKLIKSKYKVSRIDEETGRQYWVRKGGRGKQSLTYKDVSSLSGIQKQRYTINLGENFEKVIDTLLDDLSNNVERIWGLVSDLHFNIEAMMTGMTPEGNPTDFENAGGLALKNSYDLSKQIQIFQRELGRDKLQNLTQPSQQLNLF